MDLLVGVTEFLKVKLSADQETYFSGVRTIGQNR